MKKRTYHRLRALLCVLLTCAMALSLCACPAAEAPSNTPDDPPTPPNPPKEEENVIYHEPTKAEGTGAVLAEGSLALTPRSYDEAEATDIKAMQFFRSCTKGEGKVYRVTDGGSISIDNAAGMLYDCEGTVLIAPNGLIISESSNVQLTNLTIVGSVIIQNSTGIVLDGVEIIAEQTALSADGGSHTLTVNNCRISGRTACALAGSNTTVLDSYFAFTELGVDDTAETGTAVHNCIFKGTGTAIRTAAAEASIRKNTVELGQTDIGISLETGMLNTLVAHKRPLRQAACATPPSF